MKTISLQRAWEALSGMDRILILTHSSPDGDAVGSMYALYHALVGLGKTVRCEIRDVPENQKFIVPAGSAADFAPENIVSVDLADAKLLNSELKELYGESVDLNIDHHGTNVLFAKETLVDPTAAAASEVLFDLFTYGGVTLTPQIAACLYVGVSTDTGCFRFANTTPKTLRTAAALLEAGVNAAGINTDLFETKTPQYLAFERAAMNALRLCMDGKCAVMVLTQKMYADADIKEADTQGINGLPRTVAGVYVGITVKERPNGKFHASVRTKGPIDAAGICAKFGGGGHKYAAGCELTDNAETSVGAVLEAAGQALMEAGLISE